MSPRIIECGTDKPEEAGPIKFLIYGDTGTGKTYALRTLPDSMRPALILDCDRGSRKISKLKGLGTIVTFDIENARGKPVLYDQFKDFVQSAYAGKADLPRPFDEYATVVVDSFTILVKAIQDRTLQWFIDNGQGGNSRNSADQPPTMAEYGMIAHLSQKIVQGLIQLNKNLILNCHEAANIKDEVTGMSSAGPALQKALATNLPRYFDEILYAKAKGKGDDRKYIWCTQSTGMFIARTRHEIPAEVEQDFSLYEVAA